VARTAVSALLAGSLLSGCATIGGHLAPTALGAGKHRSIKDDPEPTALAPPPAPVPRKKVAVIPPPRPYQPAAGKRVEMPSCGTGTDCVVRLKALIEDPERRWINQPPSPVEFANGTRLFAYRALREKLTCAEIALALREIDQAAITFLSPVAGVTARQATNVLALNAAVGQELRAEFGSRCRG
jgi:hypothetical protein